MIAERYPACYKSFPPYAIRDGSAEFIDKIPIFDMEECKKTIVVFSINGAKFQPGIVLGVVLYLNSASVR